LVTHGWISLRLVACDFVTGSVSFHFYQPIYGKESS
jgi:hypothetical protein